MKKQILNHKLQTINWFEDKLVDWVNAGTAYEITGQYRQLYTDSYGFNFDCAIHSSDGKYCFIYQKLGTKGLLLKQGEILREINRSYYHANIYEYPAVFLEYNNNTYLAHCPISYRQLDFEEVETGELVTNIRLRKPADIFHSRLEVSPNGKYLLDKGWFWHPIDIVQVFNIEDCFADPILLDKIDHGFPDVGCELSTASFIDDSKILIGSSDEVFDDENLVNMPINSIAVWDLEYKKFVNQLTPSFEFGNLFAIDNTFAWDIYKFPKVINLATGEIVDKAEDVYSGKQRSSIFDTKIQPQISFNQDRKRLAIKENKRVLILTREEISS